MFCKFCGETLDPAQRKCRRCGREVPASTDCGGYYDVIKDLERRGITEPGAPTQVYVTQKAPESKLWVFTMICAGLLIAVILLQLVLIKKVDGLRGVVDDYDPCECTVASEDITEDTSKEEVETTEDKKAEAEEIIDKVNDALNEENSNEEQKNNEAIEAGADEEQPPKADEALESDN